MPCQSPRLLIHPHNQSNLVNLSSPRLAFAATTLLVAAAGFAQSAVPVSPSTETIILSPFTVTTERDTGFVAASSLAGGRLSGDLKDTPVAYSVLTREFIDALGLTNLTEASNWVVNTTKAPDAGRGEIFTDVRYGLSFRGVSGGAQRNFFGASGNFDSYNLDRFDYARGPNPTGN